MAELRPEDYQRLALQTEAPVGESTVDRYGEHSPEGRRQIARYLRDAGHLADQYKKGIFYGPAGAELPSPVAHRLRELHALWGMISEIAELVDVSEQPDPMESSAAMRQRVVKELGDLEWYMALLRDVYGISQAEVQQQNLDKLAARYPERNFTPTAAFEKADGEKSSW